MRVKIKKIIKAKIKQSYRQGIKTAKRTLFRSMLSRKVKKYARMETTKALSLSLKFTRKQLSIRPRIKFSSIVVFALVAFFILAQHVSKTLKAREGDIKINGQAVLVANKSLANKDENGAEISASAHAKLSPFNYQQPVENGVISQGFSAYHPGMDIATSLGSAIRPIGSGVVEFAGFVNDGHGNTVVVDHGDGLETVYAHMGKIEVGVGNKVDGSNELGTVGLTGRTTGPHVHMEVHDHDIPINPASVLPN